MARASAADIWLDAARAAETAAAMLGAEGRKQRDAADRRGYALAAREVQALAAWLHRRALKPPAEIEDFDEAETPTPVAT